MKLSNLLLVLILGGTLGLGILAFSAPIAAKPGWQHPAQGELALTSEQREQIANLRAAFHDRVKNLDWSLQDGEHASDTLQEARELRIALRQEIRDVLTDAQREHLRSTRSSCPYGGVPVQRQSATLYL
jgi:Spy/CpxP family protein refolding chaperone